MTSPAHSVLLTAALLAAKGAFLVAVAWMAVRALKRSGPVVRQWIWFSALAGLLVLPPAASFVPNVSLPLLDLKPDAAGASSEGMAARASASVPVAVDEGSGDRLAWIAAVYFSGMTVSIGWMVLGRRRSAGIRRRARRLPPEENRGLLERLRIRQATGPIRIYLSEAADVPFVRGVLLPAVVLPPGFREWPAERLKAALLHEAAHIRRRDLPARAAGAAACLLYWFNPLSWYALRRMIREQESACDLFAIGHGLKASRYAADLLSFSPPAGRRPEFGPAGMSEPGDLRYRLETILDRKDHDPRPKPVSRWAGAAAAITVIMLTAAVIPWDDAGPYAALRAEAAEFLYTDVSAVHRNILAEGDDIVYLKRLSAELAEGRFNKPDFEAHLVRLRTIESQTGPGRSSLQESARAGKAALLDRYMSMWGKYSPLLDDLKKERRSPPDK